MPCRLICAPRARDDLEAVRLWLTHSGSGPAAWRRLAAIRAEIRRVQQSPCPWPVGQNHGMREVPCAGGDWALYEVIADTGRDDTAGDVRVLRVCGPGQDRGRA